MRVANIQRFCTHDGPGIRTTVFLKGCPLRCAWCHNPETQCAEKELLFYQNKCIGCGVCVKACRSGVHRIADEHTLDRTRCSYCGKCAADCPTGALELCGKDYTAEELFALVQRDCAFYGNGGGVTLSGGEPFAQAEQTIAFLRLCRENGIGTAVETCGYFPSEVLERAVPVTDLFLWDVKDTDRERHRQYTGVFPERILNNLFLADDLGAKLRIRCILVNGINTDTGHYGNLARLVSRLKHCEGVDFLPYHSYGGSKSLAMGNGNSGRDAWIPSQEQIEQAKQYIK